MLRRIQERLGRVDAGWLFLLVFAGMAVAYYDSVLPLRPQPHHLMRQCDCLGPAYNYYLVDPNLFHPRMCNLHADNDTSGESAGEFPLIYWMMGMLWRVIGHSEFAYRLFGLLLHSLGSYALFRTAQRALHSSFWAGWVSLLFFTSPATVYFAISFLPDVPAFDLALIGWWCFSSYVIRRDRKWLHWALFFMALGALLKITAGMSLLALWVVLFFETAFARGLRDRWRVFQHRGTSWIAFMCASLLVFAWYLYAAWYNSVHGAPYTPNSLWPIWRMTGEEFERAVRFGLEVLVFELFGVPVWVGFALLLSVLFMHARRMPAQLLVLAGSLLLGAVLFVLCWFQALNNHDYYFINPQIVLVVLSVSALWVLLRYHPRVVGSGWTMIMAGVLLVYATAFAYEDMRLRTRKGKHLSDDRSFPLIHDAQITYWKEAQYWSAAGLLDIQAESRSLGITWNDRVVMAPDRTWQNTLYLAGQCGWTDFTMHLTDTASVERCIAHGARYMFLLSEDWVERPYLQRYLRHPMGEHKGIHIFDLRPYADHMDPIHGGEE